MRRAEHPTTKGRVLNKHEKHLASWPKQGPECRSVGRSVLGSHGNKASPVEDGVKPRPRGVGLPYQ